MAFVPADFWPPGPPTGGAALDQVARDAAAAAQSTANAAVSTAAELDALLATPEGAAAFVTALGTPTAISKLMGTVGDWTGGLPNAVLRALSAVTAELPVSLKAMGAKGDAKRFTTGCSTTLGNTNMTVPSSTGIAIGMEVVVATPGATDDTLSTTVAGIIGPTNIQLATPGTVTISNTSALIGTNDLVAFQRWLTAANGRVGVAPPGVYNLGRYTTTTNLGVIAPGSNPRKLLCYGAEFAVAATPADINVNLEIPVFRVNDGTVDFELEGGQVYGFAGNNSSVARGPYGMYIVPGALGIERVRMRNFKVFNGPGGFVVTETDWLVNDMSVDGCHFDNLLYGYIAASGRRHYGRFTTRACRRNFYANMCDDADISFVATDNDSTSGCCVIKSYYRQCSHIRVRAKYRGARTYGGSAQISTPSCLIEMQDYLGVTPYNRSVIKNIDVEVDDADDTGAGAWDSIVFRTYNENGAPSGVETTTTKLIDGVKLSGRHKTAPTLATKFTTEPKVECDENVWRKVVNGYTDTKNICFIRGNRRLKVWTGNLSGATTNFDLADLAGVAAQFYARLTLWTRVGGAGAASQTAVQTFDITLRTGANSVVVENVVAGTVQLSGVGTGATGLVDPGFIVNQSGTLLRCYLSVAGSMGWQTGVLRAQLEL